MLAIAFATVTVVGITTLVLIRSLRPDRQAHGLTELAVLLSAYGAVYGPRSGSDSWCNFDTGPTSRFFRLSSVGPSRGLCSPYCCQVDSGWPRY